MAALLKASIFLSRFPDKWQEFRPLNLNVMSWAGYDKVVPPTELGPRHVPKGGSHVHSARPCERPQSLFHRSRTNRAGGGAFHDGTQYWSPTRSSQRRTGGNFF